MQVLERYEYGVACSAHYHVSAPVHLFPCLGKEVVFDITVVCGNEDKTMINARYSVENLGIFENAQSSLLPMEVRLLYESQNCGNVGQAMRHISEKSLVIVETKSTNYTSSGLKFIQRTLKKIENGWLLDYTDHTTVRVLKTRVLNAESYGSVELYRIMDESPALLEILKRLEMLDSITRGKVNSGSMYVVFPLV